MFRQTAVKFAAAATPLLLAATAFADEVPADLPPASPFSGMLPMIIVMIVIIYFVMIRPEKKRQKERQEKLNALKKGDKVVTIGGLIGTITAINATSYHLKTGDGAVVEFTKSAIQGPLNDADTAANAPTSSDEVKENR